MFDVIGWFLIFEILGIVGLPLAHRLFASLPSRGYAFAKPLALLLAGYVFWLFGSLGFLMNTTGAIVFVLAVIAAVSAYIAWQDRESLAEFWRTQRALIVAVELVFIAFYLFGVVFRAYNPDLSYTEKPMDLMFLNSLARSPDFPPRDPWLSGFAVSYYYFGYLLMSLPVRLTGVAVSLGFNLALAAIMGLTASGAFAIVYDLIAVRRPNHARLPGSHRRALIFALLGALFVAFIGNLEGVIELLNAHGVGSPEFYQLLNIKGLPPMRQSATWFPDDNWWWWRASRVLATKDVEVIDEFPFFSFLIADLHPHVMALPFALLAVALALATLTGQRLPLTRSRLIWLYPLIYGALGFLNSWDFPTYTALVVLAYAVNRYRARGGALEWLNDTVAFALFVGGLGIVLYLPFYLAFSSQARGLRFDLFAPRTTFPQLILFWGFFLFVVFSFLASRARVFAAQVMRSGAWRIYALVWLSVLFAVSLVQWWAATAAALVLMVSVAELAQSIAGASRSAVADGVAALRPSVKAGLGGAYGEQTRARADEGLDFSLLMLIVGFGLVFVVEFVFILDTFGTRMNTVFKFYYQAWILIALASAYIVYRLSNVTFHASDFAQRAARALWFTVFALLCGGTLVYPIAAFATQTNQLQREEVTLDGTAYMWRTRRADAAAIEWLRQNAPPNAVIVEAVGGQYSEYGRVSAQTGIPTLLGWGGHELQWRGSGDEAAKREPIVQRIYTSPSASELKSLLAEYQVTHIFVGDLEKSKYGGGGFPFARMTNLVEKVYDRLGTAIYRVK